jgi:polysaccharide biosynthesis protein PelD
MGRSAGNPETAGAGPTPPARLLDVSSLRLPVLPPAAALVEIAVLFGLIVGLAWYTGQDLADLHPHPFWIPVLLLSLQYGTVSGLLAAGIATAFTAFGQQPEQGVGETYFVYFLRVWIETILWISAAVLLGQFRMRQIAEKIELVRQVEELAGQRTALADYSTQLRVRCQGLERRMAGKQEPDALLMLQSLGRARLADSTNIGATFSNVMTTVLPGCRAALFLLDGNRLAVALETTVARDTASADAPRKATAKVLEPGHPLYQAVVANGQGVTILTAAGEAALAGEGLTAVPVWAEPWSADAVPHVGGVIGILKIETMDASLLGPSVTGVLDAVAAVLAAPLTLALTGHSTGHLQGTRGPEPGIAPPAASIAKHWRHVRSAAGGARHAAPAPASRSSVSNASALAVALPAAQSRLRVS